MSINPQKCPRLRAVEAMPIDHQGESMVLLQDPSGLAQGPLVVSPAGFFIMAHLDGEHTLEQVQQNFQAQFNQPLPLERLEEMVGQLDTACYLDSPRFDDFYAEMVNEYRRAAVRASRPAESFGVGDGESLEVMLGRMLGECSSDHRRTEADDRTDDGGLAANRNGQLVGLVAPHLDYERGRPAYLAAYRVLAEHAPFQRAIVLGTNHYGRGSSVVATDKDFETPLGVTRTDRAFLARLEQACGADLREHEFDHVREHSVELQVLILQHLLGPDSFEIVPLLCPDPCGPTGTAPYDGQGVDLDVFARALGQAVRDDPERTIIIAGADLSHFGQRFGDARDLEPAFLAEIEQKDREVIGAMIAGRSTLFVDSIAGRGNDTRICSAGSLYTVMTALAPARAELLKYHQTVDAESGTAVSCSAMALWRST